MANTVIGMVTIIGEKVVYLWVQQRIKELKKHGLKIVAIAGSYGKTSVKHYVYELLRHDYQVVATPESFNTVMGIAKCLKWEVDQRTQVFLIEVGAYHRGDITYLLEMVRPDIGVLTGMARQHLERFGSWENIQKAKSEIAVYMKNIGGILVANGSDETVRKNVEKLGAKTIWYPTPPLASLGASRNEINIAGARKVAIQLGVKNLEPKVRSVKSRFEMTTERYGMKVIDDSFSSNDVSFVSALEHLQKQKGYTRILVTPGLVELGMESPAIHEKLGREIVGKADIVMLVGKNERTDNLTKGMGGKVRVLYIDKTLDFMQATRDLKLKKEPLVLLENDLPENY
jgi:UDP-N-acetylmuramoyl-tripeptide--D-alanyl-D-alanine ligase